MARKQATAKPNPTKRSRKIHASESEDSPAPKRNRQTRPVDTFWDEEDQEKLEVTHTAEVTLGNRCQRFLGVNPPQIFGDAQPVYRKTQSNHGPNVMGPSWVLPVRRSHPSQERHFHLFLLTSGLGKSYSHQLLPKRTPSPESVSTGHPTLILEDQEFWDAEGRAAGV
jgi:hypothetical protein